MGEKRNKKKSPKFCYRRDKQERSSEAGRGYVTVLYCDFSELPKAGKSNGS